ncbi:MAG: Twin arginine translocase protein [Pseudomonadota bacterium]|jgi:sec-independent protein translocase protein TatA
MGSFSITHWLILLAVVVVVFGTAKLKNAGKDLGGAVKGFKDAMNTDNDKKPDPALLDQDRTVNGSATRTEHKDQV